MDLPEVPSPEGQEQRLQGIPSLRAFIDVAESILAGADASRFWDCETPFIEMLHGTFPQDFVNYELANIKTGGAAPSGSSSFQLSVYRSENLTLNVVRIAGESPLSCLQASPTHSIVSTIGATPLLLDLYRPAASDGSSESALEFVETIELRQGESSRLRAGIDVADIHADRPAVLVGLSSKAALDRVWEYDRETLKPTRAITDNRINARMVYAIRALAEVGDRSALPVLEDMYQHPAHFVRWAVLKAAMKIDRQAGRRLLEHAAGSDPDPDVRTAAGTAVARFGGNAAVAGRESGA